MDEVPAFRANKRRRIVRRRELTPVSGEEHFQQPTQNTNSVDDELSVSHLLKLRKQHRSKGTGVKFLQERRIEGEEDVSDRLAMTKVDADEERLRDMSSRFVGSTGQVVDVDKHMMAYIDAELAKRNNLTSNDFQPLKTTNPTATRPQSETIHQQQPKSLTTNVQSQPQLSEFDLGPSAHETNLARTTAAIVRAQSGLPLPPEEDGKPRRPRKPRLGRDGKPLRPRPRKRRNSTDIARDALVEQMLHEHRMDVYEGPEADEAGTGSGPDSGGEDGGDIDRDEKLAEQFKQQFMDAMAERRQKQQVKNATAARAKGMGPEQSGPKLGGSRSARAKMAAMQQQQSGQGQQGQQK